MNTDQPQQPHQPQWLQLAIKRYNSADFWRGVREVIALAIAIWFVLWVG